MDDSFIRSTQESIVSLRNYNESLLTDIPTTTFTKNVQCLPPSPESTVTVPVSRSLTNPWEIIPASLSAIEIKESTIPLPIDTESKDESSPDKSNVSSAVPEYYTKLTQLPITQINISKMLQNIMEEEKNKQQVSNGSANTSNISHKSATVLSLQKKSSLTIADDERSRKSQQLHSLVQQHKAEQQLRKRMEEETQKAKDELEKVHKVTSQVQTLLDQKATEEQNRQFRFYKEELAKLHYTTVLQRKFFTPWVHYYHRMKRKAIKANNFYVFHWYQKIFEAWRNYTLYYRIQHQEKEKIQTSVAMQHYRRKLLKQILTRYRRYSQCIQAKEILLRDRVKERTKANIWITWNILTVQMRAKRIKRDIAREERVETLYRKAILKPFFVLWHDRVPLLKEEKEAEQRQHMLMEKAKKILMEL